MTDRERLIELLHKAEDICDSTLDCDKCKYELSGSCKTVLIADYLLANGVIVLPCQKGAVLNRNGEKCIANHWNIILTAFNENNQVRLFDVKEAEQKLKELKENA